MDDPMVTMTGYQLIASSDYNEPVNYDPTGASTGGSSVNSGDFMVDKGKPVESTDRSKWNRKPLLNRFTSGDGDGDSSVGSILSTGRHLLDGSAFSHRSIVNLYTEYKQKNDKTAHQRFSLCSVILASILWITCWCGVLFLPLAMIVMGFIYRDVCPSIPELPGLLIFMGIVTTINNVVNVLDHVRHLYIIRNDEAIVNPSGSSYLSTFSFFLNFVTFILIIYLAVIKVKHPSVIHPDLKPTNHDNQTSPSTDQEDMDYCSPVIYTFASWIIYLIGLVCLLVLVAILLGCCYVIWRPAHCSNST